MPNALFQLIKNEIKVIKNNSWGKLMQPIVWEYFKYAFEKSNKKHKKENIMQKITNDYNNCKYELMQIQFLWKNINN